MTHDANQFRKLLSVHIRTKMEEKCMSLQDVANHLNIGNRNWVFRACAGDNDDERYDLGVPESLLKMLNWLELEPRDFTRGSSSSPGHVIEAILSLDNFTYQQRTQLAAIVGAYFRESKAE